MKKRIRIFISYAHKNHVSALDFVERFEDYSNCSKTYDYTFWSDTALEIGSKWKDEIEKRLKDSDCSLLLLSSAFLNSEFIKNVELPALMQPGKILLPVGLGRLNLDRHDLLGLDEFQIYRYFNSHISKFQYYNELRSDDTNENFIDDLFVKMEERLDAAGRK